MIDAAVAVDRLFWPPDAAAAVPIGEVNQVVQNLHAAVLRLEQKRKAESAA